MTPACVASLKSRYGVTTGDLTIFSLLLRLPELQFFSKRQEICLPNATFEYCFQLTRELLRWKKTRVEIHISELAAMDLLFRMQSKLHFKNVICQSYLKLCIFLKDSATLRHKKKKNHKDVHEKGSSKIKGKLKYRILILIWLFCMTQISHCL